MDENWLSYVLLKFSQDISIKKNWLAVLLFYRRQCKTCEFMLKLVTILLLSQYLTLSSLCETYSWFRTHRTRSLWPCSEPRLRVNSPSITTTKYSLLWVNIPNLSHLPCLKVSWVGWWLRPILVVSFLFKLNNYKNFSILQLGGLWHLCL